MKYIELTQSKRAMVDDEDWEELSKYKWGAQQDRSTFYAVRLSARDTQGKRTGIIMHRVITNAPKGVLVDHIDGDGLNNQRSNLRLCTNSQNLANRGENKNNTSGFKGVSFHNKYKKWAANITVLGKQKWLGYFSRPELAYEAYCKAAQKYYKEFANFG